MNNDNDKYLQLFIIVYNIFLHLNNDHSAKIFNLYSLNVLYDKKIYYNIYLDDDIKINDCRIYGTLHVKKMLYYYYIFLYTFLI